MQLIFGGLQQRRGQVDDLVPLGRGSARGRGLGEGGLTMSTDRGHQRHEGGDLAGWLEFPRTADMARLAAALAASGRRFGKRRALARKIRRGRPGGVAGVLVKARLQLGQSGFQFSDPGQESLTAGTVGIGRAHAL